MNTQKDNMNTQKAYIEGFVKRANEYGYSDAQAMTLLKQANPMLGAPVSIPGSGVNNIVPQTKPYPGDGTLFNAGKVNPLKVNLGEAPAYKSNGMIGYKVFPRSKDYPGHAGYMNAVRSYAQHPNLGMHAPVDMPMSNAITNSLATQGRSLELLQNRFANSNNPYAPNADLIDNIGVPPSRGDHVMEDVNAQRRFWAENQSHNHLK